MTKRIGRVIALLLTMTLILSACGGRKDKSESSSSNTGGDSTQQSDAGNGDTSSGNFADLAHLADCPSAEDSTGVTDTEIKIGSSFPQAGLYAAYGDISKGFTAYVNKINDEGGVQGRKITLVTKDDGYEPTKTKANVEELVQADKVFALFNVIGAANNLSFWDDTDEQCVPNLFVGSGAEQWGDAANHPWTIGSIPSYPTEAAVYAEHLKQTMPKATVGVLYQNDDFGKGMLDAFKKAIEGTEITVVDAQSYEAADPGVDTQATTLASKNPDAILVVAAALKCPQAVSALAKAGANPKALYLSQVCSSLRLVNLIEPADAKDGIFSTAYLKDPTDPEWASDTAMQDYIAGMAKYADAETAEKAKTDGLFAYGWTMGAALVQVLSDAPSLTRSAVLETARNMDYPDLGMALPGVTYKTSNSEDPFPVESLNIIKFSGADGRWIRQGSLISFEGKTKDYATQI